MLYLLFLYRSQPGVSAQVQTAVSTGVSESFTATKTYWTRVNWIAFGIYRNFSLEEHWPLKLHYF